MTNADKDNLINKLTSFYFEDDSFFYLDNNKNEKKYIQVIKLIDFRNIISYSRNHQSYIMEEFLNFFKTLSNFSFVKLYEPTEKNIDIKEIRKSIELIDEKCVGNKKQYDHLLFQKINLLNLIKNNIESKDSKNLEYGNNTYIYFYDSNILNLQDISKKVSDLFNKYDCKYKMLSKFQMLDFFKNLINKDDVNSQYLNIDSRITTNKIFNLKEINEEKKYVQVNETNLSRIMSLNLKKDNEIFLQKHLHCFLSQNIFNFVLNVYKDSENNKSKMSFMLLNNSNIENQLFENETNILNFLKKENIKLSNRNTKPIQNIFPFIIEDVDKYDFNLEHLIKSNPFQAQKISDNSNFFVGLNDMNEQIALKEKTNLINLGNNTKLLTKWINFNLNNNSNVILFDFDNEFNIFNNMKAINNFKINLLDLNTDNQDRIQEIKLNKINFLISLFTYINPDITLSEISILKEILNKMYDNFIKKNSANTLNEKSLSLETLLNSINKFSKKEKTNLNSLIEVITKLTSNKDINNLINNETNINLSKQNFWVFNLSFINNLTHSYQEIIKMIFLNYILENMGQNSFIYLGQLSYFLNNDSVTKQVHDLLDSKKNFIYAKYTNLKEMKTIEDKIKPLLDKFDYVIMNPSTEFNEKYWYSIMNMFDVVWSEKDYHRLNSINANTNLIVNKHKKYWYKEENCFSNSELNEKELNENTLSSKIFEIERYIYYQNKELKTKQKKFLLDIIADGDTQKKIREENIKYIKRLL